jgi:Sec-independent protein secretion pathway component TatC
MLAAPMTLLFFASEAIARVTDRRRRRRELAELVPDDQPTPYDRL